MKNIFTFILVLFFVVQCFAQEDFSLLTKKANEAVMNKNYKEALTYFDAAFKLGNSDSTKIVWNAELAGISAQEINENEKAIEYFARALNYGATDVNIYNLLIKLAKETKDTEAEEQALLLGQKCFPELEAKNNSKLLYLYYNTQQYEKAVDMADILIEEQPKKTKVHYLKAVSLYRLENYDGAISILEQIINKEPENIDAISMLGIIYYRQAKDKFDKFTDDYNNLQKPDREDYAVYMRNIATCKPTYEKALSYLLKAYEAKPDNVLRAAIFNSYIQLEQKEKAEKFR